MHSFPQGHKPRSRLAGHRAGHMLTKAVDPVLAAYGAAHRIMLYMDFSLPTPSRY